jgi:sporulation integral membrane protein YlbJ
LILVLTAIGFIVLFALYAGDCLPAVAEAVNLFLKSVLPSIFPFYVCANLLLDSPVCVRAADRLSPVTQRLFGISGRGSFAILIGFVSGYPAGAKVSADLYKRNLITEAEALTLSAFTNNCGPLFIIGTVGAGMLGNSRAGIGLWLIHMVSAFAVGLLFRNRKESSAGKRIFYPDKPVPAPRINTAALISNAMTEAMMSMLPIAAAITFFAAFTAVLNALHIIPAEAQWLSGIVEITTGISKLTLSDMPYTAKLCLISAMAGWAGISVHIQVTGILTNAGLPCRKYICGKLCHMAIAAALTLSCVCFLRFR